MRGWLAAKQGRKGSLEEIEAHLAALEDSTTQLLVVTARSRIAAGLGDRERAIELLERARASGMVRSAVGNDMHSDPFYDVLRGDPRFERINRGE